MPNASHFERLPEEIISQICRHLAEPQRQQSPGHCFALLSLSSTCKTLHACAAGYLWRDLELSINAVNIQHQLAKLERLVDHGIHPARTTVSNFKVTLALPRPEDGDATASTTQARVGLCVLRLIRWLSRLRHLELELRYASRNMEALGHTLQYALGDSENVVKLESLMLRGVYRGVLSLPMIAQPYMSMRSLRLEHVGSGTLLDFRLFPALEHLHLEIDCRDEDDLGDEDPCLRIPSSLWTNLKTFIMSIYGWEEHARLLVRSIKASIEASQCIPNLTSLGIFWNLDCDDWYHLIELVSRFTKFQLRNLALTIPDLPSSTFITELSQQFPQVTELTLCAFLQSGNWPWPEEASSYAAALARFTHLTHLAINHDVTAFTLDADGDADLTGKFSFDSSANAALLRLQFGKTIAARCRHLQSIAFCPVDQPNGRLLFMESNGQATAHAADLKSAATLFWQD